MSPRPPTGVDRDRIVAAAIDIADREGIEPLTIRRLATALGVAPMTLYHHVADKSEILDAMVDAVFAEIGPPEIDAPWRPEMAARCHRMHEVLGRHTWAVVLMDSRTSPGPGTLAFHEATLGCLFTSGLSMPMVGHVVAVLDALVFGVAIQEAALPFTGADDVQDAVGPILEMIPPDQYPFMTMYAVGRVMVEGYDFGDEFEVGLELVLDALERAVDADDRPPGFTG